MTWFQATSCTALRARRAHVVLRFYAAMFRIFGLYGGTWIFVSLPDPMRISSALASGARIVMTGAAVLSPWPVTPRFGLIVSPLLLFRVWPSLRCCNVSMQTEFGLSVSCCGSANDGLRVRTSGPATHGNLLLSDH
ncbi:hypothetical protein LJR034_002999 [Caballeronia sp. LjRoot34]|uniref:hypothetical protein n=1 Tax=Caballeronia sp. LjRoot34 TaxID=3342325 RepID=UPI003ECF1245